MKKMRKIVKKGAFLSKNNENLTKNESK